jgi:hypothetical protein
MRLSLLGICMIQLLFAYARLLCNYYSLFAYEVIGVLGLEIVIPASSKYIKVLSIVNTIIHITLTNHFAMKLLSHI